MREHKITLLVDGEPGSVSVLAAMLEDERSMVGGIAAGWGIVIEAVMVEEVS